jgi:oligosaccharide repeat unit polymerase
MIKIVKTFFFYVYLFPIILLFNQYYNYLSYYFLIIFCFSFLLGINYKNINRGDNILKSDINYFYTSERTLWLLTIFFLVSTNMKFINVLFSITNGSFISSGVEKSIDRYKYGEGSSFIDQISSIIFFIYSFYLSPFIISKANKYKRFLFFFIYVLFSIYSISGLARAGFFISLCAAFSTFIINSRFDYDKIGYFKIHLKLLFIVILALIMFLIPAYGRISNEENVFDLLVFKLGEYSISMYYALLEWVINFDYYNITYGKNTFTVIFKIFGYRPVQGFYSEVIYTDYGETVIFTFIRGLIQDFSLFSIFIIFYLGISIRNIFYMNHLTRIKICIPIASLLFILFPFISLYTVSTFTIALLIFILTVKFETKL